MLLTGTLNHSGEGRGTSDEDNLDSILRFVNGASMHHYCRVKNSYSTHPWVPPSGSCIQHTFKIVPNNFVAMTVFRIITLILTYSPLKKPLLSTCYVGFSVRMSEGVFFTSEFRSGHITSTE